MKSVHQFLGQMNDLLSRDFGSMRRRIPAATLPYTYRKLSRKYDRIPSLNRKGCRLLFVIAMIYGMSRKDRRLQGFLMTFEVGMFFANQR